MHRDIAGSSLTLTGAVTGTILTLSRGITTNGLTASGDITANNLNLGGNFNLAGNVITSNGFFAAGSVENITASSSNLATATPLIAQLNTVVNVALNTGVRLPPVPLRTEITIINAGALLLTIYPDSTASKIGTGAAEIPTTLIATGHIKLCYTSANQGRVSG